MKVRDKPRNPSAELRLTLVSAPAGLHVSISRLSEDLALASQTIEPPDINTLREECLGFFRTGRKIPETKLGELGDALAAILFPPAIRSVIREEVTNRDLSLRLQVKAPDIAGLPWEFCNLGALLSPETLRGPSTATAAPTDRIRLVREVAMPARRHAVEEGPAVRVLVVEANPDSLRYPFLRNAEAECDTVVRTLRSAKLAHFQVEQVKYATRNVFIRHVMKERPDIVHFIGHGDLEASGGVLIFEANDNEHVSVYGDEIADLLVEAGVRLVVLSGCQTGVPESGVGAMIIAAGVPSVVAMQFPIEDASAHVFSAAFYGAVAKRLSIDQALAESRSALRSHGYSWGIPVHLLASNATSLSLGAEPVVKEPKHNLPNESRDFIGRTRELRELARILKARKHRLLTITGMGGMGKTRLAKQAARQAVDLYRDGVCYVDCESHFSEADLLSAIGESAGVEETPCTWSLLESHFASRECLLVLDCFEKLVGNHLPFESLLSHAPGLQVMVTSRALLNARGEQEYVLGPMSLARKTSALADGIRLFVDAANRADRDFELTKDNRRTVTALVRDLEGVPLAVLLAAGRLKHLSLDELKTRLGTHRLDILRRRDAGNDKHAKLLRVVEDSFRLLGPGEQALAVRLSVFHGGFYLDDAYAVLGEESDLLDSVSILRDNSLLSAQVVDGRMRFRTLDTVREAIETFADPAEFDQVRRKHAEYFAERASKVREAADSQNSATARAIVTREAANFRSAIGFAIERSMNGLLCTYGKKLTRPYFEIGARSDFERLAKAADVAAILEGDLNLRIELAGLRGAVSRRDNLLDQAKAAWQERANLSGQSGDTETEFDSYLDLADLAISQEAFTEAEEFIAAARRIEDRVESEVLRVGSLIVLIKLDLARKDIEKAIVVATEVEARLAHVPPEPDVMYVWMNLARIYRRAGFLDRGLFKFRQVLELAIRFGFRHSAGRILIEMAPCLEEMGQLANAALALTLAAAIPNSVSSSVRNDARRQLKVFTVMHGPHVSKTAVDAVDSEEWDEVAAKLINR